MHSSSSKQQELRTYKALGLTREAKSRAGRRRMAEEGIYCFIGGAELQRPYIKVLKRDYDQVRKQVLQSLPPLAQTNAADFYTVAMERRVYDLLFEKYQRLDRLSAQFRQQHGRDMTPHEQAIYLNSAENIPIAPAATHQQRAERVRKMCLDQIVGKIREHNSQSTANLQQVWAEVAGHEVATQTFLEKIDSQKGVAYCRCLSSSLMYEVKRRRDLLPKLSQKLGLKLQKIVFC